ncbi:MAG: hypothetical protein H7Z42_20090 [Roseiflexaceae bacterium]|nr:hypothetical protein [Roseiflexaceae bacterium]
MSQTIRQKLDELATLRAALVMTPAIGAPVRTAQLRTLQAELDALTAEYQPIYDDIRRREQALSSALKQLTRRVITTVDAP